MGFPVALAFWSAVGAFAATKALIRPCRAIFERGQITVCPGGAPCSTGLTVQSASGIASVYSLVTGTVMQVGRSGMVEIASAVEPIIVQYVDASLAPTVVVGQPVRAGESVGRASTIMLSVRRIIRGATGTVIASSVEPASWLASRGLRAVMHPTTASALWCAGGRTLLIPQDVARCGMALADPPGFALLPVTARLGS